jgi:hypothetical protein
LYLALELSWSNWKLAFASAPAEKPRRREVEGRNLTGLQAEIAAAKQKLGLPADCEVVSCYEAGRDGFWIHRWLETQGVRNVIVDSSSIEVNRRARRAKSDGLDAAKLLSMLFRHAGGEKVWSVVRVPTEEEEQARHLHRELQSLGQESTRHINRIKGLLVVALPTGQRAQPVVPAALRPREQPAAAGGDCGPGPQAAGRTLEVSRMGGAAGGRGAGGLAGQDPDLGPLVGPVPRQASASVVRNEFSRCREWALDFLRHGAVSKWMSRKRPLAVVIHQGPRLHPWRTAARISLVRLLPSRA